MGPTARGDATVMAFPRGHFQTLAEATQKVSRHLGRPAAEPPDLPHPSGLLRVSSERPRRYCTAEKSYELPPPHKLKHWVEDHEV